MPRLRSRGRCSGCCDAWLTSEGMRSKILRTTRALSPAYLLMSQRYCVTTASCAVFARVTRLLRAGAVPFLQLVHGLAFQHAALKFRDSPGVCQFANVLRRHFAAMCSTPCGRGAHEFSTARRAGRVSPERLACRAALLETPSCWRRGGWRRGRRRPEEPPATSLTLSITCDGIHFLAGLAERPWSTKGGLFPPSLFLREAISSPARPRHSRACSTATRRMSLEK